MTAHLFLKNSMKSKQSKGMLCTPAPSLRKWRNYFISNFSMTLQTIIKSTQNRRNEEKVEQLDKKGVCFHLGSFKVSH